MGQCNSQVSIIYILSYLYFYVYHLISNLKKCVSGEEYIRCLVSKRTWNRAMNLTLNSLQCTNIVFTFINILFFNLLNFTFFNLHN